MAIRDLRRDVKKSIDRADDVTVKMIHAMLAVHERETEENIAFDELEHRFEELENGKGVALTISQLEERARVSFRKRLKVGE